MNRREALGSMVATGFCAGLASGASAAPAMKRSEPHPPIPGPRMNFAQADKVMAELGLDALVLGEGLNFQHATGMRPVVTRMGYPPGSVAIVTRSPDERVLIVANVFSYYYTLADVHRANDSAVYLYEINARSLFPDRGEVPVDAIETSRTRKTSAAAAARGTYASLSAALGKALKDAGLSRGRFAVDHAHVAAAIENAAPKATNVDADDALRRIRPVKSATEIELMRQASAGNVAAALEALEIVRNGGSYRELRAAFFAAAAQRGQRGVFMVIDRTSDEQFDAPFRDGQAFLIDCVSEYQGYHGDYGRTVFVGEPARSMVKATQAMSDGWDKVRDALKPGVKFSEIQALGQQALKNAGRSYVIPYRPHSVGLYHTDHVGTSGLAPPADVTLEPGMIISVDCPLLESGVGGSAHLEDLMLITRDGSEPIHDPGNRVITV